MLHSSAPHPRWFSSPTLPPVYRSCFILLVRNFFPLFTKVLIRSRPSVALRRFMMLEPASMLFRIVLPKTCLRMESRLSGVMTITYPLFFAGYSTLPLFLVISFLQLPSREDGCLHARVFSPLLRVPSFPNPFSLSLSICTARRAFITRRLPTFFLSSRTEVF